MRCHHKVGQHRGIGKRQVIALTRKRVDAVCRVACKHKARRRDPATPCRLQRPGKPVSGQRQIAKARSEGLEAGRLEGCVVGGDQLLCGVVRQGPDKRHLVAVGISWSRHQGKGTGRQKPLKGRALVWPLGAKGGHDRRLALPLFAPAEPGKLRHHASRAVTGDNERGLHRLFLSRGIRKPE